MSFGGAWIDTAGTAFNKVAATTVIANVDGTPASVTAAIGTISNGTLPGLVPGVGLIKGLDTANVAITSFEKATAVSTPTLDTNKDGSVTHVEATAQLALANQARTDVSPITTNVLAANVADDVKATAAAKLAVGTDAASLKLVSDYDSASSAYKALVGTADAQAAAALALGASKGGVDVALKTPATLTAINDAATPASGSAANFATADDIYNALLTSGLAPTERTKVIAELNKITTFGSQLVAAADKANTVAAAKDTLDTAAAKVSGYDAAVTKQTTDTETLVKAQAADVKADAIKVVDDQFKALEKSVADAKTAIFNFDATNDAKVDIVSLTAGAATTVQASAKSDVFYFADKMVGANDVTLGGTTNFAAGDSIVLGSGYTFNSGALSTGNANTLEFFLVKGTTGTQVVIETEAFGNSNTVVSTEGNVTASPSAVVINLVGVTADHLSVANGVVSYV